MKTRLLLAAFAAIGLLVPIVPSAEPTSAEAVVARMKKDIFYLAGPECNGRGVGSPGIDKAADYIAGLFKEFGVKGAMKDGTYFQPFTITGPTVIASTSLEFLGPNGQKLVLKTNKEFRPIGMTGSGEAVAAPTVSG